MLDDLETAKHIALRVGEGLALFGAQGLRDPAHVLPHQRLQLQHDSRTGRERCVLPSLVSLFGRSDVCADFLVGGKGNLRQDLLSCRIDDVMPFAGPRFYEFAVEQHFDGRYRIRERRGFSCHRRVPCASTCATGMIKAVCVNCAMSCPGS